MELIQKVSPQWVDLEDQGEKISFLCGPLSSAKKANIAWLQENGGMIGDTALLAAEFAVENWRGPTKDGAPVPFSARNLKQFFNDDGRRMPLLLELFARILARSTFTEAEQKN